MLFDAPFAAGSTLLHFGAVDYNATVYLNGKQVGATHLGGYAAFGFDVTSSLRATGNELIVAVYDPSNMGFQVNGKQRISAIDKPGGDTYTPSSGLWQTVWLENVPTAIHVGQLKLRADMRALFLTVLSEPPTTPGFVNGTIVDPLGAVVATFSGASLAEIVVPVPNPMLWHPSAPNLYTLSVTVTEPSTGLSDTVGSYFGMREIGKANFTTSSGASVLRPTINGDFTFLSGFLDQSWWSDGEYTAPTDDALKFDLQIVKDLGMNMIRLHQKVNPQRWYWWADSLGVVILHDMVQKYGGATQQTVAPFMAELKDMIDGVGNHPSIIQWETFNEGDCVGQFNATAVVEWTKSYDPHRLVDTNSGGPANNLHVGDVNDIHSYPYPGKPSPSETQVAMVGEFGGIGTYTTGQHEWANGQCHTYLHVDNSTVYASTYITMINDIISYKDAPGLSYCVWVATWRARRRARCRCCGFHLSSDTCHPLTLFSAPCPYLFATRRLLTSRSCPLYPIRYTQTTDVENECARTPTAFGDAACAQAVDPYIHTDPRFAAVRPPLSSHAGRHGRHGPLAQVFRRADRGHSGGEHRPHDHAAARRVRRGVTEVGYRGFGKAEVVLSMCKHWPSYGPAHLGQRADWIRRFTALTRS